MLERKADASKHVQTAAVKKAFLAALKQVAGIVSLRKTKRDALANLVACIPRMMQQATKPSSLVKGFIRSGVIDAATESSPSIDGIIQTCRRVLTTEEMDFIKSQEMFSYFYNAHGNTGYMQEAIYDNVGVPVDKDENGVEDTRDPGITQER